MGKETEKHKCQLQTQSQGCEVQQKEHSRQSRLRTASDGY